MKSRQIRTGWLRVGSFVANLVAIAFSVTGQAQDTPRKNVLFIAIDDLRPALGCYGDTTAITPNIDRLAARGVLFNKAYCQQAVCCPSRLSLLTGRRPDTIRVWDLSTHFRAALPDIVSLPQHFKNQGYITRSIGKIYHGSGAPAKDPPSWSVEPIYDYVRDPHVRYALPENLKGEGLKRSATEAADVPDEHYIDGIVCTAAEKAMAEVATQTRPFFLAVGFRKPHLPFCAPQRYWDLYERSVIPPPAWDRAPTGAPELATRSWKELEGYTDVPKDAQLTRSKIQELRHGYYACVSYVDALVGRLMTKLSDLGLAENTVVVLWGDHGFHLGEQGVWAKATNFELATRVPLIVVDPERTPARQKVCDAFVEFVDVYPTLAAVCDLPAPDGVEGVSLQPLLENPTRTWKSAVFSQYPRARQANRHQGHGDIMGRAIRTVRYRYVEWREWDSHELVAQELYDYEADAIESRNVAHEPRYTDDIQALSQALADGWQAALPPHE